MRAAASVDCSLEDFLGQLRRHQPGERIGITVVRGGERQELQVTLAERGG